MERTDLTDRTDRIDHIVVTGATGFIGSRLVAHLASTTAADITIVIRDSSDQQAVQSVLSLRSGIACTVYDGSYASLDKLFGARAVDLVLHLATLYMFSHRPEDIDALIDANVRFGAHLLEAMAAHDCTRLINTGSFIQSMTSEAYDGSCFYAANKEAMEAMITYYAKQRGLSALTLKLFDVYGEGDTRKKLINLLLAHHQSGEPLAMTPGYQEVRLTHVDDVLSGFCTAMQMVVSTKPTHDVYYVGAQAYTLRQVAQHLEAALSGAIPIEWGALPYRDNQVMTSYIGPALPGWQARISLEEGLARIAKQVAA